MDRRWILLVLAISGYGASREISSGGEEEGNGPDVPPPAIVGGTNAPEDAWPWQVLLLYDNKLRCGGTLLNDNTILTAAHCTYRTKRRKFRVVVGEYNRKKKEKKTRGEKRMAVKTIIEHPDYDGYVSHDMSIMKLKRRVQFNTYIQPIPGFADTDMDLINSTCFVTGWGVYKGLSKPAKILQQLETPVVTNAQCEASLSPYPVSDDMICTDSEPKGACFGDSGGPLQCSVNGSWIQAGVVSWGTETCRNGATAYSRTSYHRDWIIANM